MTEIELKLVAILYLLFALPILWLCVKRALQRTN